MKLFSFFLFVALFFPATAQSVIPDIVATPTSNQVLAWNGSDWVPESGGSSNTAYGYEALYYTTTGNASTALGLGATDVPYAPREKKRFILGLSVTPNSINSIYSAACWHLGIYHLCAYQRKHVQIQARYAPCCFGGKYYQTWIDTVIVGGFKGWGCLQILFDSTELPLRRREVADCIKQPIVE